MPKVTGYWVYKHDGGRWRKMPQAFATDAAAQKWVRAVSKRGETYTIIHGTRVSRYTKKIKSSEMGTKKKPPKKRKRTSRKKPAL